MLNLIFTEAALELVPRNILLHPAVRRNAKRRNKPPEETLLDRSLHHYAMDRLPDAERRGRPDILHFCLLLAMGSPLNNMDKLRVKVNTVKGYSIDINPATRPPKDCNRFNALMEQLLTVGVVPPKGEPLISLSRKSLPDLVDGLDSGKLVALSSHGEPNSFDGVASELIKEGSSTVFIGAYPSGPMSPEVLSLADEVYSVYPESLEAWTVTSRMIYSYEQKLGLE